LLFFLHHGYRVIAHGRSSQTTGGGEVTSYLASFLGLLLDTSILVLNSILISAASGSIAFSRCAADNHLTPTRTLV
jgi:hypothetical protein